MTAGMPYIATRLFNVPLAVHPGKARAIVDALGARILGTAVDTDGPEAIAHVAFDGNGAQALADVMGRLGDPLGRRFKAEDMDTLDRIGSVAIIPIEGSLIHKGKWVGTYSGDTSYEGIQTRVRQAMADDSVQGVVFEVDSYGGEVAGAFDTAALIRELSAAKPTIAILTDFALSAGYLLASGARQIVMPASGRAGSIGVITLHADYSAALEKRGVKVTVLAAGAHKGEGNPYAALPDAAAARIRADLEQSRALFAEAVGLGRGDRLSAAAALATEADDFSGEEAVARGLADAVAHSNEAFDAFLAEIKAAERPSFGGFTMTSAAHAAALAANAVPRADHEAAVAAARAEGHSEGHKAGHAAGHAEGLAAGHAAGLKEGREVGFKEGRAEGAAAERARVKGIMDAEQAKGREALAAHFAYETDFAADVAQAALAKAPVGGADASLDAEMRNDKQPNVGADGGRRQADMSDAEKGAAIARTLLGKTAA
jgi:ClpP class serine protease